MVEARSIFLPGGRVGKIQPFIKDYEKDMISSIENRTSPVTQDMIDEYFLQAREIVKNWGVELDVLSPTKLGWYYRYYWRKYNERNGISRLFAKTELKSEM